MRPEEEGETVMVRNLVIFTAVVLSSGWLGHGLNRRMGAPPEQSLGMLLWLVAPLVTALLLRAFAGDGWKDFGLRPALRGHGRWYLVSLVLMPVIALLVLALGRLGGLVTLPSPSVPLLLSAVAAGLVPAFLKNLFEELAWRGHLAPKVHALGLRGLAGHALVGLIWGLWHVPYFVFFLGPAQLEASAAQGLASFVPAAVVSMVAASIAYGELRLLTGSVWPAVLMHTVGNAFTDILVAKGFVQVAPGMGFLASPTHQSLLSTALLLGAGLWLHRLRARAGEQRAPVAAPA
jgi:membrane protease YdiL (CAAX protease family)